MTQEVIGFEVEGRVVVGHRPSQVILVISGHRTVDVIACVLGQQVNGLIEEALALLPLLTSQTDNRPLSPDATVVGIQFKALVERLDGLGGILLQQIYLSLHRIGPGILRPVLEHRVDLGQAPLIVLFLNTAKHTVMPKILVLRIIAQGTGVVANGFRILLLIDPAEATQFIQSNNIGIAFDGF